MVTVNVFWTRPQSYYDEAPWRGRWDMDGGAFMNQASHYVDLVDWLVGPVDNVHAYTATLARDIEAEDTGVMSLRLRSGGLASINVTMLAHRKNFEGSITILGACGTVRIGGVAVNEIQHWRFDRRGQKMRRRRAPTTPRRRSTGTATRCTTPTSSTRCAARPTRARPCYRGARRPRSRPAGR